MEVQTEAPGPSLDKDIPCSQCGYDLRGLSANGRCPECGSLIGLSIARWEKIRRGFAGADQRWLKNVYHGLWLIIFADLVFLALAFVPDSIFEDRVGSGRRNLLYLATCAWVMAHWGAWKLASRTNDADGCFSRWPFRLAARCAILISVLGPAGLYLDWPLRLWLRMSWELRTQIEDGAQILAYYSLFAGVLCAFYCLQIVTLCAAIDRARLHRWVGWILSSLQAVGLFWLYTDVRGWWESSLERLLTFAVPVIGIPAIPREIRAEFGTILERRWDLETAVVIGIALMVIPCLWLTVSGLWRVRRALSSISNPAAANSPSKAG